MISKKCILAENHPNIFFKNLIKSNAVRIIVRTVRCLAMAMFVLMIAAVVSAQDKVEHVVLLSFDGLHADALDSPSDYGLTHFYRLLQGAAYTLNARSDQDFTLTLPNHVGMITSRQALGPQGYDVTIIEVAGKTVHQLKGQRVMSVFDVLKKHGYSSAMFASSVKFYLLADSFPINMVAITNHDDNKTISKAVAVLNAEQPPMFIFLCLAGLDDIGHQFGWDLAPGSRYRKELEAMDRRLGVIMVELQELMTRGKTVALIVTSDHGGIGRTHGDSNAYDNYRVPFAVWFPDGKFRGDLYELNIGRRHDPGQERTAGDAHPAPVTNLEAGNLALALFGLECIPQSTVGSDPLLLYRKSAKEENY